MFNLCGASSTGRPLLLLSQGVRTSSEWDEARASDEPHGAGDGHVHVDDIVRVGQTPGTDLDLGLREGGRGPTSFEGEGTRDLEEELFVLQ